jgi:hypothetical protein
MHSSRASRSDASRRLSVMRQLGEIIDGHNRVQQSAGLPPIDCVTGATDPDRLRLIEGLVRTIRGRLVIEGEISQGLVLSTGAQLVAWLVALEERDECRVDTGEAA